MRRRKPTIRHKIRGIRIGLSEGQIPQDLTVFIRGKVDYYRDATELFSFLFTKVPHGTMQQLVRMLADKLSWVEADMAERVAKLPQHPRLMSQPWAIDPADAAPAAEDEQMRLFD